MNAPSESAVSCETLGSCHLCGDEAVAGRVVAIDVGTGTATVTFASGMATVALDLVEVGVGDTVLVHLGFAISRLEAI